MLSVDTKETPSSSLYCSRSLSAKPVTVKMETPKGPKYPTDLGKDFIESGMRLITQLSADKYLRDLDHGGEAVSYTHLRAHET